MVYNSDSVFLQIIVHYRLLQENKYNFPCYTICILAAYLFFMSVRFSRSVMSLCDLMDRSIPGLPVHHQLPEFTQTCVHWVGDAIQPSHPLPSPSSLTFNLSQHQGLFQWVTFSLQVAKVVEFQLQHQSFQWIFRADFFSDGLVGFLAIQRTLKKEFSPTPQFKSINSSGPSFLYSSTLTSIHDHCKNHSLD